MDPRKRRFDGPLRKFLLYRDGTSRRPFSGTPIYDIDHVERYADGGPTIAPNAEGLARSDHVLRDLPGWTVEAGGNDIIRWTTPTGHSYPSRPPPVLGWGSFRPRRPRQAVSLE
jgi:hypothetical protein